MPNKTVPENPVDIRTDKVDIGAKNDESDQSKLITVTDDGAEIKV